MLVAFGLPYIQKSVQQHQFVLQVHFLLHFVGREMHLWLVSF